MESITVKGEFLFELRSKNDWVVSVPDILPQKTRGAEQWIWIDKNGNNFESGLDCKVAEQETTYPCKVYRLQSVSAAQQINKSTDQQINS